MSRQADDRPGADERIEPDVVPEDAPRGGVTVPDANDSGTTTPPISGWGETVPEVAEDDAPGVAGDPRGGR
jgi:hypothetical protein